jgi:hypothetical protein
VFIWYLGGLLASTPQVYLFRWLVSIGPVHRIYYTYPVLHLMMAEVTNRICYGQRYHIPKFFHQLNFHVHCWTKFLMKTAQISYRWVLFMRNVDNLNLIRKISGVDTCRGKQFQ